MQLREFVVRQPQKPILTYADVAAAMREKGAIAVPFKKGRRNALRITVKGSGDARETAMEEIHNVISGHAGLEVVQKYKGIPVIKGMRVHSYPRIGQIRITAGMRVKNLYPRELVQTITDAAEDYIKRLTAEFAKQRCS